VVFNLVLPQVLPSAKPFAALFAGILHTPLALLFRSSALCYVVTDQPLCYPDQATVVAGRLYIDIWIIIEI
jgi:hypothetical protein